MEITMERSKSRHYSYIDTTCERCGKNIRVKVGNMLRLCEMCKRKRGKGSTAGPLETAGRPAEMALHGRGVYRVPAGLGL